MKLIINLSNSEVKGIKEYLKNEFGENNDKKAIQLFIQGIVSGNINAPQECVSNYINKHEN